MGGEFLNWNNDHKACFCSVCPSAEVSKVCEEENLPLIGQDKEHMNVFLMGTPPPFLSTYRIAGYFGGH